MRDDRQIVADRPRSGVEEYVEVFVTGLSLDPAALELDSLCKTRLVEIDQEFFGTMRKSTISIHLGVRGAFFVFRAYLFAK
jgi:hypothetical protein